MSRIPLSRKHGVNPSLGVCFLCGEESGEIILPGRLPGDQKAPHTGVWHKHPCPKCVEWQKQGVIFISVKAGEAGDNPYRTGGWCVIKDAAVERLPVDDKLKADVLKSRVCFMEDQAWDFFGFPREAVEPQPNGDSA